MAATTDTTRGYKAKHRFAPMAPRKARYVVDLVRGLPVNEALDTLTWSPRRAAPMLRKVLQSAIANAGQDLDVDVNNLYVSDVRSDDGPTLKRGKARSRGQWFPILVRYCHLSVEVREIPEEGLPGKKRRDRSGAKKRGKNTGTAGRRGNRSKAASAKGDAAAVKASEKGADEAQDAQAESGDKSESE